MRGARLRAAGTEPGGWVGRADGRGRSALRPWSPTSRTLCGAVTQACRQHGLALPHLVLEPGRSLVARAGVAVYGWARRRRSRACASYVAVDGGMADNIRPALYGASYAAVRVMGGAGPPVETVTIAGKYCESGDVLIRDIALPGAGTG